MEHHRSRSRNLLLNQLLFLTIFLASLLPAQQEPHFELFNIASGLSTMEVTSLFQDSQGFLWIGASGDINRYNGYEFERIKLDTSDSGQLGNFQSFGFYEDGRGWIWINTDKGLFKYDPETNLSERFQFVEGTDTDEDFVLGAFQVSDSTLLVAAGYPENGLYHFNVYTGFKAPVNFDELKNIRPDDIPIIAKMAVTDPGKVWLFHYNYGLLLYTVKTGIFTQILPRNEDGKEFNFVRIASIINKPGESDYWISDANGVYKYNLKTNKIRKFLSLEFTRVGNPSNLFNNFALDADNNIWMSARNYGLYVIRDSDDKVIHFPPNPENINYLTDKFTNDIIIDKFNIMWLANDTRGLLKYDMSREPINLLKNEPANKNSLIGSYIFSISEDPLNDNVFVIGSNEAGLNIYDKNKNIFKYFVANPADPKSISMNSIRSSIRMPNGDYWLGTWGQGLDIMDNNMRKIRNIKFSQKENPLELFIRAINLDSKGNVWIGTLGSLFRYFPETDKFEEITSNYNKSYSSDVINLTNRLLISEKPAAALLQMGDFVDTTEVFKSPGGKFLILGMGEGRVTDKELVDYGWLETSKGDTVWTMLHTIKTSHAGGATKNRLRIGLIDLPAGDYKIRYKSDDSHSYGKYNEIAPKDRSWWGIQILPVDETLWGQLKDYDLNPDLTNRLMGKNINSIISQGEKVWVATQTNGLNLYDYNTGNFTNFEHTPDKKNLSNVKHFAIDGYGTIWEATSNGLVRFEPVNNEYHHYTTKDGLPSNFIESVVIDNEGDIWLATQNGICRFVYDRQTKKVSTVNYGYKDGLQGGSFVYNVALKSKKGELFFGGSNGLNYFNPPKRNIQPPKMMLTKLAVNGEKLEGNDPDSPLKVGLAQATELDLEYYQNNIEVDFIALHYARPHRNQYKHRLVGFNDLWIKSDRRFANYTNLSPGEYIFQVTGSNGDGVWNEEGISLKILISPPWWLTIPAYISYFLFFALLVFTIDRFQRHRLLKRERERTALMEAELRAKAAEAQAKIVQAENDRKTKELEEARQLQLSMLPRELPNIPQIDIAVYMKTATEVGGDYYDFHVGLDGTLTVVIGDATGHGLNAGMIVTATKSLFGSYVNNDDILQIFSGMNHSLKRLNIKKLSMCLSILKIEGNRLRMSTAGMPPALIYRADKKEIEEFVIKGMPLGTFAEYPYELHETTLNIGDTILLCSDGYPELFNDKKELFGYERVQEEFISVAHKEPESIIEHLKNTGSAWVKDADPDDDVTFVVLKVK